MNLVYLLKQLSNSIERLNTKKWVEWEIVEIPIWDENKLNWDRERIKEIQLTIKISEGPVDTVSYPKERVKSAQKEYIQSGVIDSSMSPRT